MRQHYTGSYDGGLLPASFNPQPSYHVPCRCINRTLGQTKFRSFSLFIFHRYGCQKYATKKYPLEHIWAMRRASFQSFPYK